MSFVLVTAPAAEPVSLDEQRKHMNIDDDFFDDDDFIENSCIKEAREFVETYTRRALVTQTWRLRLDAWQNVIRLPRPPMQSVTSITYVDNDGVTQTLSPSVYTVHTGDTPGEVRLGYNQVWPSSRSQHDAISITYVAGYGNSDNVPMSFKRAMRLVASDFYENREESTFSFALPRQTLIGIDRILKPFKVVMI